MVQRAAQQQQTRSQSHCLLACLFCPARAADSHLHRGECLRRLSEQALLTGGADGRMGGCCEAAQPGAVSIKEQVLPWTIPGSHLRARLAIGDVFGCPYRVTTRTWLQLHFRFSGPVQAFMKSKTRKQRSIKHLKRKS